MDETNHRQATRCNGPASDDGDTCGRATTATTAPTHTHDGGAAEQQQQQAVVEHDNVKKGKETDTKTLWVTVFKCFYCGKHGHNLPKCRQCSQAYYCNADCQRKHWKKHKPVCRAAVAALAHRAHRQRVARAVREKDNVEEGVKQEDQLCVICQDRPKAPVQVCAVVLGSSRVVQTNRATQLTFYCDFHSNDREGLVAVVASIFFFLLPCSMPPVIENLVTHN